MWQSLIGPISGIVRTIISRFVEDKDLAAKIEGELIKELINSGEKELEGAIKIILAEAQGKSWLQRNWRPVLMMSIVGIVVNNYVIFPYLHLFGLPVTQLPLPDSLYTLMTTGVGGYVVGRTGEKMMKTWKGK